MIRQRQVVALPIRSDPAGDGHYGAPRGHRTHRGVDYACVVGEPILSPVNGVITKLGYCYGDDLSWRYVQVTDGDLLHHRLFYVEPLVKVGHVVTNNMVVGNAQDIGRRYPDKDMLPHIHLEVMTDKGEYIDPGTVINALS